MDTEKALKLMKHYRVIKDQLDKEDEAHQLATNDRRKKLKAIQTKLAEAIHKEEGGIQSLTLPDKSVTAYARYEDMPKMVDRTEVQAWILGDVKLPEDLLQGIHERMAILGNTVIKDVVTQFRVDSGALEENGLLEGGDLPPGVGLFRKKEVRLTKGK